MKKIKIEIKHWITGSVLFEYESEGNTILETVKKAVSEKKTSQGQTSEGQKKLKQQLFLPDYINTLLFHTSRKMVISV